MAMKLARSTIIALWLFMVYGWQDENTPKATSTAQINMSNLVQEARQMAADGAKSNKTFWTRDESLPPTIKSLSPQFVELSVSEGHSVLDVQVSGGFQHIGYLIVCSPTSSSFIPRKGRNWRITKLDEGVFEYRE
jgi:hypothetical protein